MKQFYTDLIDIQSIIVELDSLNLSPKEKHHLAALFDSSLHQTILDCVLSELNEKDKEVFIAHLRDGNHDDIWKLLNTKIDKIEDKIKQVAQNLKVEMHQDIKEAKEKH